MLKLKSWTKYMKQFLEYWSRGKGQWSLKGRKLDPDYCVYLLNHEAGRGHQAEPPRLPEFKKWSWREMKEARFPGQRTSVESHRKRNFRDLQRVPLQCSATYHCSAHAREANYPMMGRGLEETVFGAHTKLGIKSASTRPHLKASYSMGPWILRVLP